MKLKVLILEDDKRQREFLQAKLEKEFDADVETKTSEGEFVAAFGLISEHPPHLAILDVMVRWTLPSRDLQADKIPEQAKSPEIAGLRCARMLSENPRTQAVKVILYSVLPKEDFGNVPVPEGVWSLVKDFTFENLRNTIKAAMEADSLGRTADDTV